MNIREYNHRVFKSFEALEEIADIQFELILKNTSRSSKNMLYVVLEIYQYLSGLKDIKRDKRFIYKEKIGILYYLLDDGSRAYYYLSELESPMANYYCGLILMYGKGVSVNLNKAQKCLKIAKDNAVDGAKEQYTNVNRMIKEKREAEKPKEVYIENNESYSTFCFITTAACLALGETKDCSLLNTLRAFRDSHISSSEEGRQLIEEYYRIGPVLVEKINSLNDSRSFYLMLWNDYIKLSCEQIDHGLFAQAQATYVSMVKFLCEFFSVPVKEEIMKKYSINV